MSYGTRHSTLTSIFSQTDITGTTQVDAASLSFSLSAHAHLPQELSDATWRVVVPAAALENWNILNAEEERSLLNSLQAQAWAHDCLAWIQSVKAEIRSTPIGMESMVFFNGNTITGGLMGACSFNAKGFGLLPDAEGFSACVPMVPMQCQAVNRMFESAWVTATATSAPEEKLAFLAQTHPAAWVYYKACYKLLDNAKLPKDYIQSETGFYDSLIWKKLFSTNATAWSPCWRCWSVSVAVFWRIAWAWAKLTKPSPSSVTTS